MPQGALASFNVCDACRYFAGQAWLITSQSIGHTKNIYCQQIIL